MTSPINQPISNENFDRFKDYFENNPTWGSLHIVLTDLNIKNSYVHYCIEHAKEKKDVEGEYLGNVLLTLSKTQRVKLAKTFI